MDIYYRFDTKINAIISEFSKINSRRVVYVNCRGEDQLFSPQLLIARAIKLYKSKQISFFELDLKDQTEKKLMRPSVIRSEEGLINGYIINVQPSNPIDNEADIDTALLECLLKIGAHDLDEALNVNSPETRTWAESREITADDLNHLFTIPENICTPIYEGVRPEGPSYIFKPGYINA